ncbi:hypothetical protein, partial [Salmonella sp. E393-2]
KYCNTSLESRGGFSTDRQQAGDHPPESQNTVSRNSLIGINDPALSAAYSPISSFPRSGWQVFP